MVDWATTRLTEPVRLSQSDWQALPGTGPLLPKGSRGRGHPDKGQPGRLPLAVAVAAGGGEVPPVTWPKCLGPRVPPGLPQARGPHRSLSVWGARPSLVGEREGEREREGGREGGRERERERDEIRESMEI